MNEEPNILWASVAAAERRITSAVTRLHSWPYNRQQLEHALKEIRKAERHLEKALAGKQRNSGKRA